MDLKKLPDGKIISLAFCNRRTTPHNLRVEAQSEWRRRCNERTLTAALNKQKEIIEYENNTRN